MSEAGQAHSGPQPGGDLAAELRECHDQIQRIKDQARRLVSGLDDDAFHWRPSPERWSISECITHLNTTGELYLDAIDRAIEAARSRGWVRDRPARRGLLGRWMLNLMEPPVKRRFKAPKAFVPPFGEPLAEAAPRFLALQDALAERLQAANRLDLWRAKVRSPALPLLRFSLGETFAIVAAHERRHLWQAEQVRQEPGFPRV